jgi:hypothetical protein
LLFQLFSFVWPWRVQVFPASPRPSTVRERMHVAVHAHCLHVFAASVALIQKMVLLVFDFFAACPSCFACPRGSQQTRVHMCAQLSRKMNSKMARSDNGTKKQ